VSSWVPYDILGFVCRYLATASSDHTVKIWNVDGFKLERTLVGNAQSLLLTNSPSHVHLMFLNEIQKPECQSISQAISTGFGIVCSLSMVLI
jgi:WD40 repeat protein